MNTTNINQSILLSQTDEGLEVDLSSEPSRKLDNHQAWGEWRDVQRGACTCGSDSLYSYNHDENCAWEIWERAYTIARKPQPAPLIKPAETNECPHLPKTAAALEWALGRLGVTVRQNIRRHTVDWRKDDGEWLLMNGRAAARFRSDIESNFIVDSYKGRIPLKFGREAFNEALDSLLFDHEIDPFVEYLDSLHSPTGRRKLSSSLAHCFHIAKGYEGLAEWASTAIFLGAVWRAYEPGTTLDEMPILVGPGGIGKTTFLRMAVPQHIPGLYDSGLDLAGDAKGRVEALQGKVIVECAEMMGATAGDANKIKDFISRVDDGSVRLAYRRDPEPCPRRCVLVGTADRAKFLRHDKNPRRFVPIVLESGKVYKVHRYMDTWIPTVTGYGQKR